MTQNQENNLPSKQLNLLIGVVAILILVIGFQAFQVRTLTKAIESGVVGGKVQTTGSLLDTLKSQVGGCGG